MAQIKGTIIKFGENTVIIIISKTDSAAVSCGTSVKGEVFQTDIVLACDIDGAAIALQCGAENKPCALQTHIALTVDGAAVAFC